MTLCKKVVWPKCCRQRLRNGESLPGHLRNRQSALRCPELSQRTGSGLRHGQDHCDQTDRRLADPSGGLPEYLHPPTVGNTGTICTELPWGSGRKPCLNTANSFSVDVPPLATLVVVVEEANAAQTPGSTYTFRSLAWSAMALAMVLVPPRHNLVSADASRRRLMERAARTFDIGMPTCRTVRQRRSYRQQLHRCLHLRRCRFLPEM